MEKQNKTLTMSVLMTPDMANFTGHVHGGATLKLLDQVAASGTIHKNAADRHKSRLAARLNKKRATVAA